MSQAYQAPILATITAALLVTGCAATKPPIYRWGDYEQLVYEMYATPGKADPGVQVAKLSADIERTHAEGKRVPPGVHAHLGYMYYIQGNEGAAINEFYTEKQLFPESGILIDRMLNRLQGKVQ